MRGRPAFTGRPGANMADFDFEALAAELRKKYGPTIREVDVVSAALYPAVFADYMTFRQQFADVSNLPTRAFFAPLPFGEEIMIEIERGKTLVVRLMALGELREDGHREVAGAEHRYSDDHVRADAPAAQVGRQGAGPPVQFAVGEAGGVAPGGDAVGVAGGSGLEECEQLGHRVASTASRTAR